MANTFKDEQAEKRESDGLALIAECRELSKAGKYVEAVRKYRAATGASLDEAKRTLAV